MSKQATQPTQSDKQYTFEYSDVFRIIIIERALRDYRKRARDAYCTIGYCYRIEQTVNGKTETVSADGYFKTWEDALSDSQGEIARLTTPREPRPAKPDQWHTHVCFRCAALSFECVNPTCQYTTNPNISVRLEHPIICTQCQKPTGLDWNYKGPLCEWMPSPVNVLSHSARVQAVTA